MFSEKKLEEAPGFVEKLVTNIVKNVKVWSVFHIIENVLFQFGR